jgi:hypothetical protein
VPREKAARKLEDVLRRLDAGSPELARVREVWVFGSYARGAPAVGDVDLYVRIDEPRSLEEVGLGLVFGGERPFAAGKRALGCSGRSLVSVQPHAVFGAPGEPLSPERAALEDDPTDPRWVAVQEPVVRHAVTDEPLAGPFVLLWARGDQLEWALRRLAAIPERQDARRHDRTTTVPMIDDLVEKLGLPVAFQLAVQVRGGNIACRSLLLPPAEAPRSTRDALRERYDRGPHAPQSPRSAAASAGLAVLEAEGCDLRSVRLVDTPVTVRPLRTPPFVYIDFNPFLIYRLASYDLATRRLLQIWPTNAKGPWLALDLTVVQPDRIMPLAEEIFRTVASREDSGRRVREFLSAPTV